MPQPAIAHYHAHIYYDPAHSRGRAARLRQRVAKDFPKAKLGRWHDELVRPHPQSMLWLMLNRDDLVVLLHPETGNDLADHTAHAAWFGAVLPLRLVAFAAHK